jgi:Lysyl oxidase
MKNSRWALRPALAATAGLAVVAGLPAGLATAQSTSIASGPMAKLIVAQRSINVPRYGKRVFIDPGVYAVAVGSPLQFNVRRPNYATPISVTQIITGAHGATIRRPLPGWTADGWLGLRRFIRITVKNPAGKIVASHVGPFCPNSIPQRSNPNSPTKSPYPFTCEADPFQLTGVWGIQRGWGADVGFISGQLRLGRYTVTVNITRLWQRFLHLTPRTSTATVHIKVVKPSVCGFPCATRPATRHQTRKGVLPELPANVPTLSSPPASSLPDLSPLPSWGIRVFSFRRGTTSTDVLSFGATVWSGGNSRLDVEGFRSNGSPVMKAYQYFWKNGRIIGRARAGTMGFVNKPGHDHWHFQQFAQYRLLNKAKNLALRSTKVGFCIAPTDPVSLLIPHALWQPTFTGFFGNCGSPSALWVQEMMPIGWGDTYFQFLPGQAFKINNVPNGTYYIEIIANPDHVLHESNYRNNVSLRKIILGGTQGHRTVRVPAIHGIDPEQSG